MFVAQNYYVHKAYPIRDIPWFLYDFFKFSFQNSYTLELYYKRFLHLCPSKTKLHPSLSLVCFIVSCFGVLNCFTNIHILTLVCMIGNTFFLRNYNRYTLPSATNTTVCVHWKFHFFVFDVMLQKVQKLFSKKKR